MDEALGRVEVGRHRGRTVARVVGEVDVSNAADIEKALVDAIDDRGPAHVVDLTDTTYLDSSGIRVLFALATRLQSRRQELHLVVPESGVTRRVLELTGVAHVIPMHRSLDELG